MYVCGKKFDDIDLITPISNFVNSFFADFSIKCIILLKSVVKFLRLLSSDFSDTREFMFSSNLSHTGSPSCVLFWMIVSNHAVAGSLFLSITLSDSPWKIESF